MIVAWSVPSHYTSGVWTLGRNFTEIWIKLQQFSSTENYLKMSSGIYCPFFLGFNVLSCRYNPDVLPFLAAWLPIKWCNITLCPLMWLMYRTKISTKRLKSLVKCLRRRNSHMIYSSVYFKHAELVICSLPDNYLRNPDNYLRKNYYAPVLIKQLRDNTQPENFRPEIPYLEIGQMGHNPTGHHSPAPINLE